MVDVIAANRPRMERDGPHLRRPADDRNLRGADLIGGAPRGEPDLRSLHIVGGAARDPLLEERIAAALLPGREDDARMDPFRPALERRGAAVNSAHDAVVDRQVVVDDVELRDRRGSLGGGEYHSPGIRYAQITSPGVNDHFLRRRHGLGVLRQARRAFRAGRLDPVHNALIADRLEAFAALLELAEANPYTA